MVGRTRDLGISKHFLVLAVATSLVIVTVGAAAGSEPEWVMLKASVGLMAVGTIGWMLSAVVSASAVSDDFGESLEADKGANVDLELPEAVPGDSGQGISP